MATPKDNNKIEFTCPHCQFMYNMLYDYLEHDKFKLALRDGKISPEAYQKFINKYNKRAIKRIKKGDKILAEAEARFAMREMERIILKDS